jgi:hypothetical protein
VSFALGEFCDEIHGDVGKWFGTDGRWNSKYWGFDAVCQVLVLLAGCAAFDVFCDPGFDSWPEVFFVDASDRFILSRMSIDGSFVPYVHQFVFQALIWWYDKSLAFDISPEWFIQVVNAFDWIDACPFFH